jgi:hypothetical protein
MKMFFKLLFSVVPIITLIVLVFFTLRLYPSPEKTVIDGDTVRTDLLGELRFIHDAIDQGADGDMQNIYPEGYVFIHALYALSWADFARTLKPSSGLYQEAHAEMQNAYDHINATEGRGIFDESLPLPYGAFYTGWSVYVLGKKLSTEPPNKRNPNEEAFFKLRCGQIASAIHVQQYPLSYPGGAWPADVVLCVAALSLHDRLYPSEYKSEIQQWIKQVKENVDSLGLIPHEVHPLTGKPLKAARGSSEALILCFMIEIDKPFAAQQFAIFKKYFVDDRFGLPGILEYAKGTNGSGDIDSGPLVLDMGAAATIVGVRTMNVYHEYTVGRSIRSTIEALGIPMHDDGRKKYLLGKIPMADAFISWVTASEKIQPKHATTFWVFHFYSALVAILSMLLLWLIWRRWH